MASQSPSTGSTSTLPLQKHSCATCQKRKVKCDRRDPCGNCVKAGSECEFKDPPPPRRRKKRPPEEDLLDRCRRYEELLKGYGAQIDAPLGPSTLADDGSDPKDLSRETTQSQQFGSESTTAGGDHENQPSVKYPQGRLVVNQTRTRLVDNGLWVSLSDEFRNPSEILQDSCSSDEDEESELPRRRVLRIEEANEEDLVFGSAPRIQDLSSLHPNEATIRRLWQLFVQNVNPLSKILHVPTMEKTIYNAAKDVSNLPKNLEVLMFSIYACAVASLSAEQCTMEFGEEQSRYLAKQLGAGRFALTNARFLRTSDIMVLQGLVLYFLAARKLFDPRSLWTLCGLAMRIGQRIGLHRDATEYGLDPFEVNMRSRLWWQIIWIDARSAELSGTVIPHPNPIWDSKGPLNVNDSDIYPGMEKPPQERMAATEMIFVLIRYEMAQHFRKMKSRWTWKGAWCHPDQTLVTPEEKLKAISDLEGDMERKFLRYCDPLVPLHQITTIMARSVICIGRIIARHPRHRPDKGANMPQEERDDIFNNALKALGYDTLAQTTPSLQPFLWHTHAFFQWPAVIVLLDMLRKRTIGEDAENGWRQLETVYGNHPEMITDNSAIHNASAGLAIKAWEARSAEVQALPPYQAPPTPRFIHQLYARRARNASKSRHSSKDVSSTTSDPSLKSEFEQQPALYPYTTTAQHWGTPDELASQWQDIPFSQSPMDWNEWDQLLQGFEAPNFAPDLLQVQGYGQQRFV